MSNSLSFSQPLYKIQELVTTGWEDIDEDWNINLTKEQCDIHLQECIDGGISTDRLKVVRVA